MGLFSRKKKATVSDTDAEETGSVRQDVPGEGRDDQAAEKAPVSETKGSASEAGGTGPDRTDSSHLDGGPFDVEDAPEAERIDLGGMRVPGVQGMELRMEVDQRTRAVTGANLVLDGTSMQIQAFAAPKSRGLWDDVRTSLRDSVVGQGGTAETRGGPFGTELIARLPLKRADGRIGYRPARFIGVDGRRWFVRAVLSGPALGDIEAAQRFETILSQIVVVRGSEAMAPQELIPLHLPGKRPTVQSEDDDPLKMLERGPEITEIG